MASVIPGTASKERSNNGIIFYSLYIFEDFLIAYSISFPYMYTFPTVLIIISFIIGVGIIELAVS